MMRALCLALFLALSLADYCGPWIAVDPKAVPAAQPTDVIEVYYMAAPLLYCSNLNEFTYINGYHGGIGIVNTRSQQSLTVNFQGYPSFSGAFLPIITKETNGSHTLKWQNFGKTFIYNGINDTYWHSLKQHVAVMNGTQFNQFFQWVAVANTTFTHYNPWFVYSSFPSTPLLKGFECFQFAIKAVQKVRDLGAQMIAGYDTLKVSVGTAYSHAKPIKVNFWDPAWNQRITEFFLLLDEKWGDMGFGHFIEELWDVVIKGDFFVRDNDEYYYFDLSFPFFEMHWKALPIDSVASAGPIIQKK